ncbi:MAG: DUF4878 domain-containing protein [Acidobacteriota bacterium]|nr:DUF4878 domain-containing protein [Pyrinomonadaceae bacterium]MDW8304009.1 DUF4878 domain-containing protein [Acidobacteriota bacterium]
MKRLSVIFLSLFVFACASESGSEKSPVEVLKQYVVAFKKSDTTEMKSLLSKESLKMAQEEAKAQGMTVDEVLLRETFFDKTQDKVEFKNETIQGEQATVEIKDKFGIWQRVYFVREDGSWKIAKEKGFHQILHDVERKIESLEKEIKEKFPFSESNSNQ